MGQLPPRDLSLRVRAFSDWATALIAGNPLRALSSAWPLKGRLIPGEAPRSGAHGSIGQHLRTTLQAALDKDRQANQDQR